MRTPLLNIHSIIAERERDLDNSRVKMPYDKRQVLFLFFLVTVALFRSFSASRVDRTLDDGAIGSNVVRATIAKLRVTNLLQRSSCSGSLYQFLRRIAYVESKDGTVNSSREQLRVNGGIWRVNMARFGESKNITDYDISFLWPALHFNRDALTQPFYNSTHRGLGLPVMWNVTQYQDLSKPLYSATAALLTLLYIPVRRSSNMITGINYPVNCETVRSHQAQVWSAAYTSTKKNAAFFDNELPDVNGE